MLRIETILTCHLPLCKNWGMTSSGAHPASCSFGGSGSFAEGKVAWV